MSLYTGKLKLEKNDMLWVSNEFMHKLAIWTEASQVQIQHPALSLIITQSFQPEAGTVFIQFSALLQLQLHKLSWCDYAAIDWICFLVHSALPTPIFSVVTTDQGAPKPEFSYHMNNSAIDNKSLLIMAAIKVFEPT